MLIVASTSLPASAQTVADHLAWTPLLKRTYGTPKVVVKQVQTKPTKITFLRPARTVFIRSADTREATINRILRGYFLKRLWADYLAESNLTYNEDKLNVGDLSSITYTQFLHIGQHHLAGQSTGNPVHDAWWKVRNGSPMQLSRTHMLAIATLEWDDPTSNGKFGHFACGLRRRGGDPTNDAIFDFRAPWHQDRRPRITEGPNIHNLLKLQGVRINLYDWLYTQTEYRNSIGRLCFANLTREQVTLLLAFDRIHHAGNFRVFKQNCASLGTRFLNQLLPMDERIKGEHALADFPKRAAEAALDKFGGCRCEVLLNNQTRKLGRIPTNKSQIHRAQPSRSQTRTYRTLQNVPEIN